MENIQIYSGSGQAIGLALISIKPRGVTVTQMDQITDEIMEKHGSVIAVANMDKMALHIGRSINPQFLIREFGWTVAGMEPYKAPSRADTLQKKQEGFDASIVQNAVEAEKKIDEEITDTGTDRAVTKKLGVETAKRGALNVVESVVAADKAEGQGAEPPQINPKETPKKEKVLKDPSVGSPISFDTTMWDPEEKEKASPEKPAKKRGKKASKKDK